MGKIGTTNPQQNGISNTEHITDYKDYTKNKNDLKQIKLEGALIKIQHK